MPVSAVNHRPTAPKSESTARIAALDWTKGALVIFMVIYHAINYSSFGDLAFRFLAFVPPSFILIAGFLVGQVYATKYDLSTWKPYLRLALRGLKVLLLFVFLNILYCVASAHGLIAGISELAERSKVIFLLGNGRGGIFEVLLPIAYFLLLAPGLLWARSRMSASIWVCAAGVFSLCLVMEMKGQSPKNLILFSAGIIGMALGLIRIQAIDRLARKWAPVLLLYLAYRIVSYLLGETYGVQMLAATVSVLVLYCAALHLDTESQAGQQMVLLGKYSLLGYLIQIAILKVIIQVSGGKPEHSVGVLIAGIMTMSFTLLFVKAVHAARRESRIVSAAYNTVFA